MHTIKNHSTSKIRMAVIAPLLMVCIICCSQNGFAQKPTGKKPPKVTLAGIDSSSAPLSKVLANPVLTTNEPGCEVTKFSMMILPEGGNIQGPFFRTGAKIGPNQLSMLSEFTNMKVRVFIDEVHVKCKGQDTIIAPGVTMRLHP